MKKNIITISLLAGFALVSCNKEQLAPAPETETGNTVRIEAALENDGNVKSHLEGTKVLWSAGDKMKVFAGTEGSEFTYTGNGNAFEGTLAQAEKYVALYPFAAEAAINAEGTITTVLPAAQTAVTGTFADQLNLAVGVSGSHSFQMKNVCALVKFEIDATDIEAVVLSGNGDEALAGKINITVGTDGLPSYTVVEGQKEITLRPAAGTFEKGSYYFTVLPQAVKGGFTLEYLRADGKNAVVSSTKDATLKRSIALDIHKPVPTTWMPYETVDLGDIATLTEGTTIKGRHVKVNWNALTGPYTIKRTILSSIPEMEITQDGEELMENKKLYWMTIEVTTTTKSPKVYQHEITYTIGNNPWPHDKDRFCISYTKGSNDDKDLFVIGFTDPYPGTPLPVYTWVSSYYAPVHVNQSTYLTNNTTDKAFWAGTTAYTVDSQEAMVNDAAPADPCPAGWHKLTSADADGYFDWLSKNLKSVTEDHVFLWQFFGGIDEASLVRTLGGYARTNSGTGWNDLSCWGDWPNATWIRINEADLSVSGATWGSEWPVGDGYGIPYRCIRAKEGWN